jgi:atypical dual specificity phosphatase
MGAASSQMSADERAAAVPTNGVVSDGELFALPCGDDLDPEDLRVHMHMIEDRLFLGNNNAAHDIDVLESNGVTHIVNCLGGAPFKELCLFTYFSADIEDMLHQEILSLFYPVTDFISRALEDPANVVFVHCAAGVSRSAAMVIAFLMRKHEITAAEAYKRVKSVRKIIRPNEGFQRQLILWQRHLFHDVTLPVCTSPVRVVIHAPIAATHPPVPVQPAS